MCFSLVFFSLFLLCLCAQLAGAAADYNADQILLNCGGPPVATDNYGREWTTDTGSKFASPGGRSSTTSPAANSNPAVPAVPYATASVFRSPFTYTFPVNPGRIFLSLDFYVSSYAGLDIADALFTVTTQSYTLLNNFSVMEEAAKGLSYNGSIMKQYWFNVEEEKLIVTFTPASSSASSNYYYGFMNNFSAVEYAVKGLSYRGFVAKDESFNPSSSSSSSKHYYAFVNGIEVVSFSSNGKLSATEIAFLLLTCIVLLLFCCFLIILIN